MYRSVGKQPLMLTVPHPSSERVLVGSLSRLSARLGKRAHVDDQMRVAVGRVEV